MPDELAQMKREVIRSIHKHPNFSDLKQRIMQEFDAKPDVPEEIKKGKFDLLDLQKIGDISRFEDDFSAIGNNPDPMEKRGMDVKQQRFESIFGELDEMIEEEFGDDERSKIIKGLMGLLRSNLGKQDDNINLMKKRLGRI